MERRTRIILAMACTLALALAPACWGAQDPAPAPAEGVTDSAGQAAAAPARVSEFALYGWLTGVNADVGIGPLQIAVDSSFSDNLENLDVGIMAYYETWVGGSGFYLDLIYARLSDAILVLGPLSVDYDAKQTFVEAGTLLRRGAPERPLDIIVGVRYTDRDSDYQLNTGLSGSKSQHWVDPIIGLRQRGPVSDKWTYSVRADRGGFGLGSNSTCQFDGSF